MLLSLVYFAMRWLLQAVGSKTLFRFVAGDDRACRRREPGKPRLPARHNVRELMRRA
jgi:hypothetical protein